MQVKLVAAPMPVFVIGMPRPGTTLIEQTIASHPVIHGAGELPDLNRLVDQMRNAKGDAFRSRGRAGAQGTPIAPPRQGLCRGAATSGAERRARGRQDAGQFLSSG